MKNIGFIRQAVLSATFLFLSGALALRGVAATAITTNPKVGGLYFYHQIEKTPSTPLALTITNTQATSLTINSITATTDFPFTTDCLNDGKSAPLAAGAACTVQVTFLPQAVGDRSTTLSIVDSVDPGPVTAALTGAGIAGTPGITVTVAPNAPCGLPSQPLQFSAIVTGTTNTGVTWFVDGIQNGNSTVGPITTAGLYTPPGNTGSHVIKAVSKASTSINGSTAMNVTTSPSFGIYPYLSAVPPGAQQTFQPQICLVPDSGPVSFTVDNIAGGNSTVGTITGDGVYTAPAVAGKHTVRVTDLNLNKTSGAQVFAFSSISADFGSRSFTTYPIAPNMFGTGRGEAVHSVSDRQLLLQGGIGLSRLYSQMQYVYATQTPDWTQIDPLISSIQAAGQQPIVQLSLTPPWLQPSPNPCGAGNNTVAPANVNTWAQLAASYVAHMDAAFPGFVQDYEIWNEPDGGGLCATSKLDSYLAIYAAAAPAMKAQAAKDGATIHVGGPVLSVFSSSWISSLLSTSTTAPYVDFVSYHQYLFGSTAMQVQWDTYNGNVSMYEQTQDPNAGPAGYYNKVLALVQAGKQPLGGKTPIYITEFNTNWAFYQDCCRNDNLIAPVWSSMYISDLLNSIYSGTAVLPNKLVYFASAAYPWFCMIGVPDANMDCLYSAGATPTGYPQYFTYQLLASSSYLGLVNGGYMAKSISPPSGGGGLVTTAFYTSNQDSVLITNPTPTAYSNIPLTFQNTGFKSPSAMLYQIVNGAQINSSSVALKPQGASYTTTISVPAYSVQAVSLTGQPQ